MPNTFVVYQLLCCSILKNLQCLICYTRHKRTTLLAMLTREQLCQCSWFGGLSWLLLEGADLSSVLLPGDEEEEDVDERPGPGGFLKLLFIPADKENTKTLVQSRMG